MGWTGRAPWAVNTMCLAAIERVALGVDEGTSILRAFPNHFLRHRRSDTSSIEEERGFGVEIDCAAIILELITTAGERCKPRTVRVEIAVVDPSFISKCARSGIAHRRCDR